MVVLRAVGIIIRSSKNTTLNLVDSCFWYGLYLSGICCDVRLSKHTSVFSNFSTLVVSVARVLESVVNVAPLPFIFVSDVTGLSYLNIPHTGCPNVFFGVDCLDTE